MVYLEEDARYAKFGGFLQIIQNYQEKEILLYFRGFVNANDRIATDLIWEFKDVKVGWKIFDLKLLMNLRENFPTLFNTDISSQMHLNLIFF